MFTIIYTDDIVLNRMQENVRRAIEILENKVKALEDENALLKEGQENG